MLSKSDCITKDSGVANYEHQDTLVILITEEIPKVLEAMCQKKDEDEIFFFERSREGRRESLTTVR